MLTQFDVDRESATVDMGQDLCAVEQKLTQESRLKSMAPARLRCEDRGWHLESVDICSAILSKLS